MSPQQERQEAAILLIQRERDRQVSVENYDNAHDDGHDQGELFHAAFCYFVHGVAGRAWKAKPPAGWPWSGRWWKPKTQKRNLERAGALTLAERERLLRVHGDATTTSYCDALFAACVRVLASLLEPPNEENPSWH